MRGLRQRLLRYNDFLIDFQNISNNNQENKINFGDFIDSLKIDLDKYWEIVYSPNKQLRMSAFKVLRQSYYLGLISHLQASEMFLIYLNDDMTEIDLISGKKIWDGAIEIIREICRKDTKLLFKLDMQCVSINISNNLDFRWKESYI